jgi:hypothetical protein
MQIVCGPDTRPVHQAVTARYQQPEPHADDRVERAITPLISHDAGLCLRRRVILITPLSSVVTAVILSYPHFPLPPLCFPAPSEFQLSSALET